MSDIAIYYNSKTLSEVVLNKQNKKDIHDGYLSVSEFLPKKQKQYQNTSLDYDFRHSTEKYGNWIVDSNKFIDEIDFLTENIMQMS